MAGPGQQGGVPVARAGGGATPLEFEAFEEMSRSALRTYAGELTPEAVAGNSWHWTTARDGITGVLDRLRAVVEPALGADVRGAFPEAMRAAHSAFADGARALGEAVGRPAGYLDAAAPRLGDVRTRVAATAVASGLDGFPGVYLFAEPSAELAALMESLYVPAVQQAVAEVVLPGPQAGDGEGPARVPPTVSGDDGAGPAAGRPGTAAADGVAEDTDTEDGDTDTRDGDTGARADGPAGDGALRGTTDGADPGRAAPGASPSDAAAVDAAGHSAGPEAARGAGVPGASRGAAAHAPSGGVTGADAGGAGVPGAGPVNAAAPGGAPGRPVAAAPRGGPHRRGRAGGAPPVAAPHGSARAGDPAVRGGIPVRAPGNAGSAVTAVQDGGTGAARRPSGAGLLGTGARGRGRGEPGRNEDYESAEFLTTVGHSDQLIGTLGTVVHPVLGAPGVR